MNPTRTAILHTLTANQGRFVSGEALSRTLGVSRAAIAKAIDGLRQAGYEIESAPRRGHRLVRRPDLLIPFEVTRGLATSHLGQAVTHYERTASTQFIARELADGGAAHGSLVIAEEQTGGRGRLGRTYCCPRGGIWCTLILRLRIPPSRAPLAGLAAGVAAAEAIRSVAGLDPLLKWPNDVLVNSRKVAGILSEMDAEEQEVHYLLVGTGMNVNFGIEAFPEELAGLATTLAVEAKRPVSRVALLQRYLERLESLCDRLVLGDTDAVLAAWRALPNMIGRRITVRTWDDVIDGYAVGLDATGSLLVERAGGAISPITTGEVIHIAATP